MAEKRGGTWSVSIREVQQVLRDWYLVNRRDLPWRQTRDPYRIWISEIILQQTQVRQGVSYYRRFLERFPDVESLAKAEEQEVLRLWQGLGYYSRARNLHSSARYIWEVCEGVFPRIYEQVYDLKGVGPYTAAAICAFAYDQAYAVLDGNVFRFLARYTGCALPINEAAGKKVFSVLAQELLDSEAAHDHNQAIMEFGALKCVPVNPDCLNCPLQRSCQANQRGVVDLLPVKKKKGKVRDRYFNYFLVIEEECLYVRKREGKDIWQNLFELPLVETLELENEAKVKKLALDRFFCGDKGTVEFCFRERVVHKLSHQTLHAQFWVVKPSRPLFVAREYRKILFNEWGNYPVPRLIEMFLEKEIGI